MLSATMFDAPSETLMSTAPGCCLARNVLPKGPFRTG